MSDLDTAPIRADLEEIRKKYEASRGISYEDLSWLLNKMHTALTLADAARTLSKASQTLVAAQQAEITRLTQELAIYEL